MLTSNLLIALAIGRLMHENICIDGGMTRQMIYHNDFGWTLEEKQ